MIAKKDVRLLVRRKLQAKRMGNSSGAGIDDCDSSVDPQTRSLSAIAVSGAGEIDASTCWAMQGSRYISVLTTNS
jgi:hypothetical protein